MSDRYEEHRRIDQLTGRELDKAACLAVGWPPYDPISRLPKRFSDDDTNLSYAPVSTRSDASAALCLRAISADGDREPLGWPVVLRGAKTFGCYMQEPQITGEPWDSDGVVKFFPRSGSDVFIGDDVLVIIARAIAAAAVPEDDTE